MASTPIAPEDASDDGAAPAVHDKVLGRIPVMALVLGLSGAMVACALWGSSSSAPHGAQLRHGDVGRSVVLAYVDAGCGCGWLDHDNCVNQDACAVNCRRANGNPKGC